MRPRRGNIWALTEKGMNNAFVKELFERYDMKYIVPAKWILAGYVVEIPEEELQEENTENECNDVRNTDAEQRVDSEEV